MERSAADVDEPITIVDYDPAWPLLFAEEQRRVEDALGDVVTRVEHFGSTAVVGMAGKADPAAPRRTAAPRIRTNPYRFIAYSMSRPRRAHVRASGPLRSGDFSPPPT
jgi:hypothetical protein